MSDRRTARMSRNICIEHGNEKDLYYCDSWGQYWDEITNKTLDKRMVEVARLDEINGVPAQSIRESGCWERTEKGPIRVRWHEKVDDRKRESAGADWSPKK